MKLVYLLPIILLILLALVIWWFIRSSNARRDELAREEAHVLRQEAAARHEATLAGQRAYAEQAEQRHGDAQVVRDCPLGGGDRHENVERMDRLNNDENNP